MRKSTNLYKIRKSKTFQILENSNKFRSEFIQTQISVQKNKILPNCKISKIIYFDPVELNIINLIDKFESLSQ